MIETATPSPAAPAVRQKPPLTEQRLVVYIVLALIAAVLCSYAAIVRADFIDFDDNSHVFENALVKGGLSWSGVQEAFTKSHATLWIPLTWISFMADISFFGLNPGAMHAVNLAWHLASTVLLFLTLRRLTGNLWASAFVAALFGLHPVNVESVAWVTERKNVLSTFFWLAAIAAYARYAEQPRPGRYLAVLLGAALALLSKPMAVTLPCTLLLLDVWPLERWRTVAWPRLLLEKIPLFLFSIGTCWMTLHGTPQGALISTEALPLAARVSNALVSYAAYLGTLFWPFGLGVFYPYPLDSQLLAAGASALLLLVLTGLAVWQWKRRRYLLVGWCWFLGVLVPGIGLVHLGSTARADRFSYVPQLGVFVALTWLAKEWLAPWPGRQRLLAGAILLGCALLTVRQVSFWMDGRVLFEHTIAVTKNNALAHAVAGLHYARANEPEKAIEHFQASLRIQPEQTVAWQEFGAALLKLGRPAEAITAFRMSLRRDPDNMTAHYKLAVVLQDNQRTAEAIEEYQTVLRSVPNSYGSHYLLGRALLTQGRVEEARQHLQEAARLAPQDAEIAEALRRVMAKP